MSADKNPIRAFSDVTHLPKKILYCYKKKGLLAPVERDLCSGSPRKPYLTNPSETPEGRLLTEIQYPVV